MVDAESGRPLRHARVELTGASLTSPRTAITEADGRFAFEGLASAHYALRGTKAGYVPMFAGASGPQRLGRGLDLAAGQVLEVTLRLPRGAVIAGTITDAVSGDPLGNVWVQLLQIRLDPRNGRRRAEPVRSTDLTMMTTDDLGGYRLYGLAPGEYLVLARAAGVNPPGSSTRFVSGDEIRAALAGLGGQMQTRPGLPPVLPPLPPARPETPPVVLTPTYFPGTPMLDQARPIVLGTSEERLGIDFALGYAGTVSVSGAVSLPPGALPPVVTLGAPEDGGGDLIAADPRLTTAGPDGQFTFPSVAPGQYALTAHRPNGGAGGDDLQWGEVPIVVGETSLAGITIPVQQPLNVTGRIVFEGMPPARLPSAPLPLPLASERRARSGLPRLHLEPDGRFQVRNLVRGRYFLSSANGVRQPINGWWLTGLSTPDADLLEAPLTFSGDLQDVEVRLSRTASTISGSVRSTRGQSTAGLHVVLFPADPRRWFFSAFRIAHATTDGAGRFTIRNLPAGEYLVAVSGDLEEYEWYDRAVLERLAATAAPARISATGARLRLVWDAGDGRR